MLFGLSYAHNRTQALTETDRGLVDRLFPYVYALSNILYFAIYFPISSNILNDTFWS